MSGPEPATSARSLIGVAGITGGCLLAWLLGSALTEPNLGWYATLAKPGFTPPNAVFPVAWTVLFVLMAVSAWLVWRADAPDGDKRTALTWFGVQLVLNTGWTFAFFFMQSTAAGLAAILVLLVAIVITIVFFARVSRPAALLLLPYVLWVGFATALNAGVWILNSGFMTPTAS